MDFTAPLQMRHGLYASVMAVWFCWSHPRALRNHGGTARCTPPRAKAAGRSRMLLDALPSMHRAIRLYESLGFLHRDACYDTPLTDTVFMELQL